MVWIEFYGRSIPTTLEEMVQPEHTAVLVVDMQNDYVGIPSSSGFAESNAQKYGRYLTMGIQTIERTKKLLEEARKASVLMVYTMHTATPRGHWMSDGAGRLYNLMKGFNVKHPKLIPEYCIDGTWGHQVIDGLKPEEGDLVVKKYRQNCFTNTNLDVLLRANGIKTLIITGYVTYSCVEAAAREASQSRDYFVVVLRDCVDCSDEELHTAALKVMESVCAFVVTSDTVLEIWKKSH